MLVNNRHYGIIDLSSCFPGVSGAVFIYITLLFFLLPADSENSSMVSRKQIFILCKYNNYTLYKIKSYFFIFRRIINSMVYTK